MNGKASRSGARAWVTRGFRCVAGSRGTARACVLPIRARRLRPLGTLRAELPDVPIVTRSIRAVAPGGRGRGRCESGRCARASRWSRRAIAAGIEVVGDVELVRPARSRDAPRVRVLGVTGTNGKTTVTALAAAHGRGARA